MIGSPNTNFSKAFVFYGADIAQKGIEFLLEMHQKGYVIVALDVPAVGMAANAKIPYTVIDDWLTNEELKEATEKANYCEENWYIDAHDQFSIDGICWPEFDHSAMHNFWAEVCLCEAFAHEFVNRGGVSLVIFRHDPPCPSVYYYSPTDVGKAILISLLHEKVMVHLLPSPLKEPISISQVIRIAAFIKNSLYRSLKNVVTNPNNPKIDLTGIKDSILIAINPGEVARFTPIIENLVNQNGLDCSAAVLTTNKVRAIETSKRWKIPVIIGYSEGTPSKDTKDPFLLALKIVKDKAKGKPWERALNVLDFHFKNYCEERWPRLLMDYRLWCTIIRNAPPRAIIVSSLLDAESHLPTAAAKYYHVPSFSILHGGVSEAGRPVQDFILYGVSTQCIPYTQLGVSPGRLLPAANILMQNEYPVQNERIIHQKNRINILVLTTDVGFLGFLPHSGIRGQMNALTIFNQIPTDLTDKIEVYIKVHPNPRYSDIELIEAAGIDVEKYVLPRNSDLASILESVQLVVAVNNWSTSVLQAAMAGKPLILLWTTCSYGKPEYNLDFCKKSGKLVHNGDEFWDCIRRYIYDPAFSLEMHHISEKFKLGYLDNSAYPDINTVIQSTLTRKHFEKGKCE
jgi:hypothetical protein